MKCFNCGNEISEYLCQNCRTKDILDKVFNQICFFNQDTCTNPHLIEYVETLTENRAERNCIPEILELFPKEISEYYYCVYYWIRGMEEFEPAAIEYLDKHDKTEKKSQRLISYLLKKYIRNDFIKPRLWCDWIAENDHLFCELYSQAATYFAMIAEYDLADALVEKGLGCKQFLYFYKDNMRGALEKQREEILRYRTKKPYWPKTEERRRAVAMFYDEKGISYPRIENKPAKVPEDEFEPINECVEEPTDYCAFWCADTFSVTSAKPIYQIAAVKIANNKVVDTFQSFIRPWDGSIARKDAAKKAGVSLSVIEGAEDVDQVMTKFFDFVGDSVLVSTGALGDQAKLLCRAVRYAGLKRIPNELFDLLDFAADTDSKFDMANNNRDYLLAAFHIAEGADALEKAKANVSLYEALNKYGV